jgi:hypothetical protein
MNWFKSQRHNNFRYIVREWAITTLTISAPLLLDILMPELDLVNRSYWYYFIPAFSFFRFIGLCQLDRVNEIVIDTNLREVSFKYYDINEGEVWKSYPFETLRLKISPNKLNWLSNKMSWLFEPLTIYFLKGRQEVMSISKSKDGFSMETLESLKRTLEELTSTIKK